jgi:predicted TIM-barrel fold metal-dependent hydrolase
LSKEAAVAEDILVSADAHYVEPTDLFLTRLPKHLRELAVWEEDFEIEPLGDDGYPYFRKLHTPGFEGWTYARYRHHDGSPQTGDPARIVEDLDTEGIHATLMHPNHALFGLYTHDHHELAIAHARVYNDYVADVFAPYRDRVITTFPVPLSDLDDAVVEIERVAALGARAIILPATSPIPYSSRALDRVWAAAETNRLLVAFHVATGGVKVSQAAAPTLQGLIATVAAQKHEVLDDEVIVGRLTSATSMAPMAPQRIVTSLVGSGVTERFPDLHFLLVEFNAHWLVSTMAAMDKAWTLGVGQFRDWWAGTWDDDRAADDQPNMQQIFRLNERWPYPLAPSEYVRRQIHVSFQEDPVAIACRHVTGVSTLVWGADYPHAEGTFTHSRAAIDAQFGGVERDARAAIVGGTLGGLLGLEAPNRA